MLPLDLHVLGLSLAFILSQDQTLRCNILYNFLFYHVSSERILNLLCTESTGNNFPSCTTIYCLLNLSKLPALLLRFLRTPSVSLRLRGVKKTTERSSSSSLLFSGAPFHKCLRSVSSFAVRAVTAVTSLRTVQLNALFSKAGAKLLLFSDMTKYFYKKIHKKCTF